MTHQQERRILLAIIALSVLLRVAVALYLGNIVDAPPLLTDQRSYHALGARLIAGEGFSFARAWYPFTPAGAPTAHWSFLQSLFVAAVYAVFGVHPLAARLAEAVLGGILLPLAIYALAHRVFALQPALTGFARRSPALIAAFLAAVYFYFVLYSATLMTETFYIVALILSLERSMVLAETMRAEGRTLTRPLLVHALTLGVCLGVATLFRQSILPWIAVLFFWLLWTGLRRRALGRAGVAVLLAGLLLILFILPFTARNYRAYGQFLLLNSNTGYAMYSAQHPIHGTSFREFDAAPLPQDLVVAGLNEAQWDRALLQRGIGFVVDEPMRYLLLSLSRVRDYFEFWPSRDTSLLNNIGRVGSFGLLLPFMLYGIWLALRADTDLRARRWGEFTTSPIALLLLFVVTYSVLHILTWAFPRYRLPVDAVLLLFAALAIAELANHLAARRAPAPTG